MTDGHDHEVGSVTDEAAKLLAALSGWAHEYGSDVGHGVSDLAATFSRAAHGFDEHIATGAEECQWCPVCRGIHLVRETSPEVKAHLASAASSLMQAAAGLLATDHHGSARRDGSGNVEHIDLDEE